MLMFHAFDAVMQNTTVVANRSKYVDFTMPCSGSGARMVVLLMNSNLRMRNYIMVPRNSLMKHCLTELWLQIFDEIPYMKVFLAKSFWSKVTNLKKLFGTKDDDPSSHSLQRSESRVHPGASPEGKEASPDQNIDVIENHSRNPSGEEYVAGNEDDEVHSSVDSAPQFTSETPN
ncbi:hypothetical protein Patl1_14377 [Pistacia atlantica]|uniref:Uncharacterized protein n=1 Tax=Pistacia atlantica TaxID=434234 RepID=A0ACC1AS74_9ROSI|nr:hypothetical protein Patl1_14377 [Pistacia atlantica]